MFGENPIASPGTLGSTFNIPNTVRMLTEMRASIGLIRYLNHRGVPDINSRLTNIVNDMGDQWNHGQAVWNAMPANTNAQTTIGDFWSEWVQDFFPWLIVHTIDFVQNAITEMRNYWAVSTDDRAQAVLDVLASLEAQLTGLTIDTSRMN
jgi:chitinase